MKRSNLKRDAEKVREFMQRGRGSLARSQLNPSGPRKTKKAERVPEGARQVALARSRGLCVMCLWREGFPITAEGLGRRRVNANVRVATDLHHVLPKRSTMFPAVSKESENLVALCRDHHSNHEAAFERLPLNCLPRCTIDLILRHGPRAIAFVLRTYPAAGVRGDRIKGELESA